jgi:hypothetical protein
MNFYFKAFLWTILILLIAYLVLVRVNSNFFIEIDDPIYLANSTNAKKVKLKMSVQDVIQTMGDVPENGGIIDEGYAVYYYNTSRLSSFGIIFYFDSSGICRRIQTEDSSLFDTEYRDQILKDGQYILDTKISDKAGKKYGH